VEGAFGTAWYAFDLETNEAVFIKLFKATDDPMTQNKYRREWSVIKKIEELGLAKPNDPASHVVGLKAAHFNRVWLGDKKHPPVAFQVLELCERDLQQALVDFRSPEGNMRFSVSLASYLFDQIVKGVLHMNKWDIYHRDLKLENILLTNLVQVKITDFGLGTDQERTNSELNCDSLANMPPWDFRKAHDNPKLEVFQCGVLLLNMLAVDSLHKQGYTGMSYTGQAGARLWQHNIYEGLTFEEQCEQSRDSESGAPTNGPFWKVVEHHGVELSCPAKKLLNQMLDVQPETRIKMDQVEQTQILAQQTSQTDARHEMKERLEPRR